MATFAVIKQDLGPVDNVNVPAFNMIQLMGPGLYVTESGDNLIHRYEIGGVVWDTEINGVTANQGARSIVNEALIAQRLDANGDPVQEWRPFVSTEPLGNNNETILPTHVYRQRNATLRWSSASEVITRLAQSQDRGGPVSVRVRRSLDDFTGLFLQITHRAVDLQAGTNLVEFSAWGQLYFRSKT